MRLQTYKFTSTLTEDGEVLESCEVNTASEQISDVINSFKMLLIASGFSPKLVNDYLPD